MTTGYGMPIGVTDRLKTPTGYVLISMSDAPFEIGEPVADRDRSDPAPAIVVNRPPQTADEWIAYTNTTVAEDNPNYPPDAPVIVVVYRHDLADFDPDWPDHDGPFSLAELNETSVSYYAFPAPRLRSLATDDDTETSDEPAKAEFEDAPAPDSNSDSDPDCDPTSDPPAAVRALQQRLDEGGMTTALEDDNQTIRATKLGETYRVRPDEVLEGDGALRNRLEQIVTADHHTTD